MKTIGCDDNGNLLVVGGMLIISSELEAIRQACTQTCSTLRGEMMFSADKGVDYEKNVWNQPDIDEFYMDLSMNLMSIPGVVSVGNLNLDTESSSFKYSVEVSTIYGKTSIYGSV